jgi:MerR family copper efflux transcriptional regulator
MHMKVGEVARMLGVSSKALRTWEAAGLVPGAPRSAAGYRHYAAADLATLRFIAQARQLGFSTERIRGLLALWQDRARPSAEVKHLALGQAAGLRAEAAALAHMAAELERLAAHCHGDARPECPILDALAKAPARD